MARTNPRSYLRSLAAELRSQRDRVRDLIGNSHWLSDGRHKEHLLAEVVRRHLPVTHQVGPGFVVSPSHELCSTEQDILVVNCQTEAPLFTAGGLLITI